MGKHLKSISNNQVPSPYIVLRAIKELSCDNTTYTSDSGISYNFNINMKLNRNNINALKLTNQLKSHLSYNFDYYNQILSNNKYEAKNTYKNTMSYFSGV